MSVLRRKNTANTGERVSSEITSSLEMKQCTHSQEITSDTVSKHSIKVLVECDYFNGGPLYSYVIALLKKKNTPLNFKCKSTWKI